MSPLCLHKVSYLIRLLIALVLVSVVLLPACRSIRPVAKIGLIAPFEGLYRRTGYAALTALRAAIDDTKVTVDVLPLALDESLNPSQTAQKLLLDSSLLAVIGPLSPETAVQVAPVLSEGAPLWLTPFVVDQRGTFAHPMEQTTWATELIVAVASVVRTQGYSPLVLAGMEHGWPSRSATEWQAVAGLPVLVSSDPAQVPATAAVLFVGPPDQAVPYLADLRLRYAELPFFLGPLGGDPVFAERSAAWAADRGPVFWVTWLTDDYAAWAAAHDGASPAAYLVYCATRQALAVTAGAKALCSPAWVPHFFTIEVDGSSVLATFD